MKRAVWLVLLSLVACMPVSTPVKPLELDAQGAYFKSDVDNFRLYSGSAPVLLWEVTLKGEAFLFNPKTSCFGNQKEVVCTFKNSATNSTLRVPFSGKILSWQVKLKRSSGEYKL